MSPDTFKDQLRSYKKSTHRVLSSKKRINFGTPKLPTSRATATFDASTLFSPPQSPTNMSTKQEKRYRTS